MTKSIDQVREAAKVYDDTDTLSKKLELYKNVTSDARTWEINPDHIALFTSINAQNRGLEIAPDLYEHGIRLLLTRLLDGKLKGEEDARDLSRILRLNDYPIVADQVTRIAVGGVTGERKLSLLNGVLTEFAISRNEIKKLMRSLSVPFHRDEHGDTTLDY